MKHRLTKGLLYRDDKLTHCPFSTKSLMQLKGHLQPQWVGSNCGTHCPLFQLHESKAPEDTTIVSLSCGGAYVSYEVEVSQEETSEVPLKPPLILHKPN